MMSFLEYHSSSHTPVQADGMPGSGRGGAGANTRMPSQYLSLAIPRRCSSRRASLGATFRGSSGLYVNNSAVGNACQLKKNSFLFSFLDSRLLEESPHGFLLTVVKAHPLGALVL